MAARQTQYHAQPDKRPAASPGRFGLLLIVLILTYLLSAFAAGRWLDALPVVLFTGAAGTGHSPFTHPPLPGRCGGSGRRT